MHEVGQSGGQHDVTHLDRDLLEGQAAIELVACGAAVRVHLHGFPYAGRVAATLAAAAQQAGVAFRLERNPTGTSAIVVGPRLGPEVVR